MALVVAKKLKKIYMAGDITVNAIQEVEPQQRAHSPWVLPFGIASHAAGLASESKLDRIPYGRKFRVFAKIDKLFYDATNP